MGGEFIIPEGINTVGDLRSLFVDWAGELASWSNDTDSVKISEVSICNGGVNVTLEDGIF